MPRRKNDPSPQTLNPLVGAKIAQLRDTFGESQAIFGERFGVEQATVSRWEKGFPVERKLEEPIANLAGMTVAEFFHSDQGPRLVPIVGKLMGGAQFEPAGRMSPGATIEHIKLSLGEADQVAVRVEDNSMFPAYRKGDVIIAKRLPKGKISEALGRDCVIVAKGTGYIRVLNKGSRRGLYRLRSFTAEDDIDDIEVDWVAPISWINRSH